jgi:hypothetical protein
MHELCHKMRPRHLFVFFQHVFIHVLHVCVCTCIQLIIYVGLLLWLLGWSALAGLSILFLSMPVIGKLSAIQQDLRKSALEVPPCARVSGLATCLAHILGGIHIQWRYASSE